MTSRPRVSGVAAVVLAVTAAAGGCGGDGKNSGTAATSGGAATASTSAPATGAPATTPATSTVAVPAGGKGSGACRLLSTAEAAQVAGTAVQPGTEKAIPLGPVTASYCFYLFNPGNAPAVLVAVFKLGGAGRSLFDQFRQDKKSESDYQEVGGVGEEAFFASGNLNLRKGETGLILSVQKMGPPRGIAGLADDKRLAALVLSRL